MSTTHLCSQIREAISAFVFEQPITEYRRYGNGHINDTFLLSTEPGQAQTQYILQRINHFVFRNPSELMENIHGITRYLNKKIAALGGDPTRETLNLLQTTTHQVLFQDSIGSYWRCYYFVEDTVCYDKVENPADFYESGIAFGHFQELLADYPAHTLYATIPDFHHTPRRYQALEHAAAQDCCGRAAMVGPELTFIRARQAELGTAIAMHKQGQLPLRVTHNDTKLNNVLFDKATAKAICVIDLDTIMPGLSMYDFGDTIRFGANTALEDETDLSKVSLSLPYFDLYTKGFLTGCGKSLTDMEIQMLPSGAKLMTLECGIRFLTDYLQGDTYFKIHHPAHNLDRTRTQLELVADMERKWPEMLAIVKKYRTQ